MNSLFWERAHGGLTHLPIALIFAAAFFDALAFFCRRSPKRGDFKAIGYWLVIVGALGSFGAVFSGLVLSKGTIGGTGAVLRHHLFCLASFHSDCRHWRHGGFLLAAIPRGARSRCISSPC